MRAIKRSKRFEVLVRQLAETNNIFPTMRELMCFAAVLGFEKERRKKIDGPTMEIDGRIFENSQQSLDLLYLLALAENKDADVLRDENENEALEIFEEYAEGGFEVLSGWVSEKPEDEHGDKALLTALSKYGYLQQGQDADSVAADVSFS